MVSVSDPFDPRDNILAGTAYLKEMHDRFDQQASLRPTTQVRRAMNSTSQQANHFHRTPWPTLRQSRHCSATGRVNAPHFASNVRFLGRKLRCLSSVSDAR